MSRAMNGQGNGRVLPMPLAGDVEPAREGALGCRERPRPRIPAPGGPLERGDRRPRVLLVEDYDLSRRVVVEILQGGGYEVLAARDGAEAWRLAHETDRPLDLLVTDVILPGSSGIELARDLRREWPELPVLFVSGHPAARDAVHESLGASAHFLDKPFPLTELLAFVARLVGR
jgi:CheY-like chemotaxis protein